MFAHRFERSVQPGLDVRQSPREQASAVDRRELPRVVRGNRAPASRTGRRPPKPSGDRRPESSLVPATPQPAAASDPTRACVEASLRECPYLEVRQIVCRCHEGVVVLFGEVPSYYLKAVAQALVSRIEGVEYVDNRVKVRTALE